MKFTDSQADAITHNGGNLQLIACAGSGKTEIVARRVAHLLKDGWAKGLRPRNLMAFTFTERAAAELKDRILTRCREAMPDLFGMAEMYVGTIHGFALELLMTEVHEVLKFDVLNEVQQMLFIDRHSRASGLTTSTDLNGQPLRRYVDTKHFLSALSANATLRVAPAFGAFVASAAVLRLARWLFDRAAELDLPDSDEAPLLPAVAVGWVRYVPWVVLSAAIMRIACGAH